MPVKQKRLTGIFQTVIIGCVKDLKYLQLFDAYGALLTDTQREMCGQYYLYDLSLSEIAEEKGVSKQSVSDTLKKSRELLDYYEDKLHHNELNQKFSLEVSLMMTRTHKALEEFKQKHPEFSKEVQAIADMVAVSEVIDLSEEK